MDVSPCTIAGSLSATGAAPTVTGTARTVTVPGGNSGKINATSVVVSGDALEWRKNAGAWSDMTVVTQITFVSTDTVQVRGIGMAVLDTGSVALVDNDTGTTIATPVIEAT